MLWIPLTGLIVLLAIFKLLAVVSQKNPPNFSETGPLQGCPSTPNCVSSQAETEKSYIAPLFAGTHPQETLSALGDVLKEWPGMTVNRETPHYVRAEYRSRWFGFVDDLEFFLAPNSNEIQMRSASRVGYSDLGANRRRLEAIRDRIHQVAGMKR